MIFQHGVSSVAARGIAEAIGYSYATLYHYFTDLDEPLYERTMQSFALEKAYYDDFIPFAQRGSIKETSIPAISRMLLYSVFGIITLYLSNNGLAREEIDRGMQVS